MSEKKTILHIQPPQTLRGTGQLPSSKSLSNRALIIDALMRTQQGGALEVGVKCLAQCDDTDVMLRALSQPEATEINILAAGTAMRFLTAYYACMPGERVITGTPRMCQRPIAVLVEALHSLGAEISYVNDEGFPPLRIKGAVLKGQMVELSGHVSSQYISALLLIAPILPHGLTLRLTGDIVSRSYIDMTLALMRNFGASVAWVDECTIVVAPQPYQRSQPFVVESDWSAASYWYELVALSPDPEACITLPRLYQDSLQGDRAVADYYAQLGVHTEWLEEGVRLTKQALTATHFEADLTLQPDIAQTIIATLCALHIPFRISGLQTLRIKETDRIAALQTELAKFGYLIAEEIPGTLVWNGQMQPNDATRPVTIATYDDHRMAMAFAPLALALSTPLYIAHPEVVTKSYPTYWEALAAVGFLCV